MKEALAPEIALAISRRTIGHADPRLGRFFFQVFAQPYKQQSQSDLRTIQSPGIPSDMENGHETARSQQLAHCNRNMMNLSHIIEALLYKYDKHLLPDPYGVNVTMEIHIQEISSISELTSDFELDLMYSEIW